MAKLIREGGMWVIRSDWDEEDIIMQAENIDVELTDEQVYKVMQLIVASHDANIGINWEVIDNAIASIGGIMSTPYYHTDESAQLAIKTYRDDNGHDSYHDALISMGECLDDLDDEERSAYNHVMRNNALHYRLLNIKQKVVTGWSVNLYWSDGSVEERTDSPEPEYMNDWIDDIQMERRE